MGRFIPPEDLTSALQDAQLDCDWLPYEVFEKRSSISGKHVQLYGERYKAIVVPPVEVIPQGTLAKAKQFFEAGGVVIGYGFLPSKSASLGHDSAEIAALCGAIWGPNAGPGMNRCRTSAAGGRSYLLNEKPTSAQLRQVLADAGIRADMEVLAGETGGWLHVLHRVKAGQNVFLVCNQNHQGARRQFKFRATAAGEPECWDAVRNEITSIPFQRTGESSVEFSLSMEPLESVLIVFSPKRQPRPSRIEAGAKPIGEPILVRRDPNPTPPTPIAANLKRSIKASLAGCKWVWFPEGNPAVDAPRHALFPPDDHRSRRPKVEAGALPVDGRQHLWPLRQRQAGWRARGFGHGRRFHPAIRRGHHAKPSTGPQRFGHRRHEHLGSTESGGAHRPVHHRF